MTKRSERAWVRRGGARVLIGAGLLASLLGGCGGHSTAAPLSFATLLSALNSTTAGSPYNYASVLVTSGHGTRRFVRASLPRHIAVEMSCRGGRSVTTLIDGRFLVEVGCAPGQAGGDSMTIGRASTLTVTATPATRWSLAVAAGTR